ncbi:hypothetical protein PR048_033532 [Dryococelus australis]|uniref:Uncharacterized protein n=1 Tax=Dryococelus australis TaxID=614101 RepID=A0ABQ9G3U2_9NEOP|nr:hypothetical protein PR048_033532 [Dryococelus australis]
MALKRDQLDRKLPVPPKYFLIRVGAEFIRESEEATKPHCGRGSVNGKASERAAVSSGANSVRFPPDLVDSYFEELLHSPTCQCTGTLAQGGEGSEIGAVHALSFRSTGGHIFRHDGGKREIPEKTRLRAASGDPAGNLTRFALVGGGWSNHHTTAAPCGIVESSRWLSAVSVIGTIVSSGDELCSGFEWPHRQGSETPGPAPVTDVEWPAFSRVPLRLTGRSFSCHHLSAPLEVPSEWSDYSPPTYAIRVRFPVGSLLDVRARESYWTMPLFGGFFFLSRGSPRFLPRALHSGAAPCSPHFTLTGSQDLEVKSHSILSHATPHFSGVLDGKRSRTMIIVSCHRVGDYASPELLLKSCLWTLECCRESGLDLIKARGLAGNRAVSTHWLSAVTVECNDWTSILQEVSNTQPFVSEDKNNALEPPVRLSAGAATKRAKAKVGPSRDWWGPRAKPNIGPLRRAKTRVHTAFAAFVERLQSGDGLAAFPGPTPISERSREI